MTSLHWQTSLQAQKGHALTQSLKGTGYGLDFEVKEMTLLCLLLFAEALHNYNVLSMQYLRFVVKSSPKVEQFQGIIPHVFCDLGYALMMERHNIVWL